MTCPDCERYKQSASMWRNKAYELNGTPLPWKPRIDQGPDYERGFIDGMQYQMHSSVNKAVNRMAQPKQEPVWIQKSHLEQAKKAPHYCHVAPTKRHSDFVPMYPTTPQRTWVGLTDEERRHVWRNLENGGGPKDFADAIEAKLKEKNT